MSMGKTMLGRRHVLPSVLSTLTSIQIEGTFPTGSYLVTVHHPISSDDGDLNKALYGSFLPVPSKDAFILPEPNEYEPEKAPELLSLSRMERSRLMKGGNESRSRLSARVIDRYR